MLSRWRFVTERVSSLGQAHLILITACSFEALVGENTQNIYTYYKEKSTKHYPLLFCNVHLSTYMYVYNIAFSDDIV